MHTENKPCLHQSHHHPIQSSTYRSSKHHAHTFHTAQRVTNDEHVYVTRGSISAAPISWAARPSQKWAPAGCPATFCTPLLCRWFRAWIAVAAVLKLWQPVGLTGRPPTQTVGRAGQWRQRQCRRAGAASRQSWLNRNLHWIAIWGIQGLLKQARENPDQLTWLVVQVVWMHRRQEGRKSKCEKEKW